MALGNSKFGILTRWKGVAGALHVPYKVPAFPLEIIFPNSSDDNQENKSVDPKLDPEIESIISRIKELMSTMEGPARVFNAEYMKWQESYFASMVWGTYEIIKKNESGYKRHRLYEFENEYLFDVPETSVKSDRNILNFIKSIDRSEDFSTPLLNIGAPSSNKSNKQYVPSLGGMNNESILSKGPEPFDAEFADTEQRKAPPHIKGAWGHFLIDAILMNRFPGNPFFTNLRIVTLFDRWYDKFDATPETPLRDAFIERLKKANWLSEAILRWRALEDRSAPNSNGAMSREDVLVAIGRIFQECYFKPLGINKDIIFEFVPKPQSYFCGTTELMGYHTGTSRIGIFVNKDSFGCPPNKRGKHPRPLDHWNNDPIQTMDGFLEELHHKFDHDVCKKYLRGEFSFDSPWINYARPLVPQFPDTPGQCFYVKGTYYALNPIERNVRGLLQAAAKAMRDLGTEANRLNEQVSGDKDRLAAVPAEKSSIRPAPRKICAPRPMAKPMRRGKMREPGWY
jgi:hypothetical protein